ncbi:hypothetical protein SBA6_420008 [Candidatus Sulfopaludibacter sp. SbA6]|nr:hypothetical protein SBA6_420008 [Candidatus Sulfopaludibacter sp. SbA6]
MSVLECVTAATKKVLDTGMIDPTRVGLVGHSWGGFGTSFGMTQSDLFAAGVRCMIYPGENHSLAVKANQMDYHRRILDWFGYYLKGDPPPEWITKGVTVLDRQKELKRTKRDSPSTPAAVTPEQ